ncbi:MAG: creatininase family protein [Candidatus Brocadiia bacterium]
MSSGPAAPDDATGEESGRILADTMTSVQMAAHRRRNGILLLPVGSFEMHGYHVGMSCDTFVGMATCRVLAEEWDAVVLPPVYYTFSGATKPFPGTVDVPPPAMVDYLVAVISAIFENGFKRLVLIGPHGPHRFTLQTVLRTVFRKTGQIPVYYRPQTNFRQWVREEYEHDHGEAAAYLAALYICGRHGEFDPAVAEDEIRPSTSTSEHFEELGRRGVISPYYMVRPEDHVPRYPGLTLDDAPRLAQVFRDSIREAARGIPEVYGKWQQDMWQALEQAPWDDV